MFSDFSVIICAAGKGERTGFAKNKVLMPLEGMPVLYHTLQKFNDFEEIIITASPLDMPEITAICSGNSNVKIVEGGRTRTDSVYNALQAVTKPKVLIHDGARPYISADAIKDCVTSVETYGSGICGLPAVDTMVLCDADTYTPIDRNMLFSIQTPQGFITSEIKNAYNQAISDGKNFTDDSSLYKQYIGTPHICNGNRENVKLTYAEDFTPRYMPQITTFEGCRTALGIDIHAFGGSRNYVVLGGVKIDCEKGLIAHSDGDVLTHSVMDALLSCVGLKDIGTYFPDTDEKWKNADSLKMLEKVVEMLLVEGYMPLNLCVTVQAEKPKLKKYIDEIKSNLAKVCRIDTSCIAVSAGTCEGLGFVGQSLGICCYCVATCIKTPSHSIENKN